MGTPRTRLLLCLAALLTVACDDGAGGGTPVDAAVTADGGATADGAVIDPDAAIIDRDGAVIDPDGAVIDADAAVIDPDAAVIDPDAAAIDPDAAVIDPDAAAIDPDAALPDSGAGDEGVPCMPGEADCACGLNNFCGLGLACVEGTCVVPCRNGAEGCPCDRGACDPGFACNDDDVCGACTPAAAGCPCAEDDTCEGDLFCEVDPGTCRVPEECAEIECAEHELCNEPQLAGEVPTCAAECEAGFLWNPDTELCDPDMAGVTCEDLGCADDNRGCIEDGGMPRCGDCLDGFVEDGACRLPRACLELDCDGLNRDCAEGNGADAQCTTCQAGFDEVGGVCQAGLACDDLDCGDQNRECVAFAGLPPACGACLAGYLEDGGACVIDPNGCVPLNCGAQNRVCAGDPAACGACRAGYVDRDGVCVIPARPNCQPGAEASILADCQAQNRVCDPTADGASCGSCAADFVEDPDTVTCVPPVVCDDLNCAALGRACGGEPFATCGDCEGGTQPADPDDPNSACLPPLTCADIVCPDGEFCLEGDDVDAACSPSPCDEGEAFREDQNACVTCNILCGEDGETGDIWPFTLSFSSDCLCATRTGYYADVAGAIRARPCDADGDGWVRLSARASLESADEAIRDNARCALREVDRFVLQNELGQQYTLRVCEEGLSGPDDPPCAEAPAGLYETVRNDDALELSRDGDVPDYTANGTGRPLRAEEINSLTKACVSQRADHNHNGLADVTENHAVDAPQDLDPALRPFLQLGYFVELHRGSYRAPAEGALYGSYVIAERSRCADGFPLGYPASEGPYWRSCMRNRDVGFDTDPAEATLTGYDFALHSCDADSGSCPTPPPVTGAEIEGETTPHALCTVPAPDDGVWRGMSHHSQFRCMVVTNPADLASPRSLAPEQVRASELYNGVQGTRAWQLNVCRVACPEGDADCNLDCGDEGCATSSEAPGGLANGSQPILSCAPTTQNEQDSAFAAGTVGFASARYVDVEGTYVRGCINEWEPGSATAAWKDLCPGYTENPFGVVGDANSGNFGRLLCGCGFGFGGVDCDVGCPSMAVDTDGDGVTDADAGPLHYGGDLDDPLCDNGYCPIDPSTDDGGRRGWWACGAFPVTSMEGADPATPHALTGGGFSLQGAVMPTGFSGESCEAEGCAQGWSLRPATLSDLNP